MPQPPRRARRFEPCHTNPSANKRHGRVGGNMDGFLLARSGTMLRATGTRQVFLSASDAADRLRAGGIEFIAGAMPFDPSAPAALIVPEQVTRSPIGAGQLGSVSLSATAENPTPEEHMARVAVAVERIRRGDLAKVVLARSVDVATSTPIDPEIFAAQAAARYPGGNVFAVDLSAAGGSHAGTTLIGASPEVLVSRRGTEVTLKPLAGSAPRGSDPDSDAANAQKLLDSSQEPRRTQLRHRLPARATQSTVLEDRHPGCADSREYARRLASRDPDPRSPGRQFGDRARPGHIAAPHPGGVRDAKQRSTRCDSGVRGRPGLLCRSSRLVRRRRRRRLDRFDPLRAAFRRRAQGPAVCGRRHRRELRPADELAETTAKLRTLQGLLSAVTA